MCDITRCALCCCACEWMLLALEPFADFGSLVKCRACSCMCCITRCALCCGTCGEVFDRPRVFHVFILQVTGVRCHVLHYPLRALLWHVIVSACLTPSSRYVCNITRCALCCCGRTGETVQRSVRRRRHRSQLRGSVDRCAYVNVN